MIKLTAKHRIIMLMIPGIIVNIHPIEAHASATQNLMELKTEEKM